MDLVNERSNVVEICMEYEALKKCIKRQLISLKFSLSVHCKLNTLRTGTASEGVDDSGVYFSYMLLIDLLKRIPQIKQAKESMLNKLKDYYRGDRRSLGDIEPFRNTLTSDTAIDL